MVSTAKSFAHVEKDDRGSLPFINGTQDFIGCLNNCPGELPFKETNVGVAEA